MIFALVDCNNFYCSCERIFRPDLKNCPVLVLSNNDGCAVSRSQEVKALGIKTGDPLFKIKGLVEGHNIEVFSSNYTLYGDISARVMHTLESFSPLVEIYSIDEAFLRLDGFPNLEQYARSIRVTVLQHTGIPVSVGLAPTKTLAKLASYAAKKYPQTGGVVDLSDPARRKRLFELVPVTEVWGVGRRIGQRLENMGIRTVLQLVQLDLKVVRQKFSIVLERTVRELNGESCLELEDAPPPRQQVLCSRSFAQRMTGREQMGQAIAEFTARGAEKLRNEKLRASVLSVSIRTSSYSSDPQYSNTATGKLTQASSDTSELLKVAGELLDQIWRDGYRYAKGGIMLTDLSPENQQQLSLLEPPKDRVSSDRLMQTIDQINKGSRGKVWFGSQRPEKDWFMRRDRQSPSYTTKWEDIPLVRL